MARDRRRDKVQLRPAQPEDLPFAWSVYRDLMRPLTVELLGTWRDEGQEAVVRAGLASGDARVVLVDGEAVGWLHVREREGRVELMQIYVVSERQGQGIGTALLEDLRSRGLPVELSVMRNNLRAIALYERLGFRVVETSAYKHLMRWLPTTPGTRRPRGGGGGAGPG